MNSNVDAFDASAVERIDRGENRQVWIRGGEGYAICKSLNVRIKYPSLSYPTRSFKSPLVEMRWAAGRLVVERLPSNATYRVIRQESEPRALIFARLYHIFKLIRTRGVIGCDDCRVRDLSFLSFFPPSSPLPCQPRQIKLGIIHCLNPRCFLEVEL